MIYKLSNFSNEVLLIDESKNSVSCIPFASDNTDYQQYLKWLAEGNTPEPADQGE
jgi:hypothetical protein